VQRDALQQLLQRLLAAAQQQNLPCAQVRPCPASRSLITPRICSVLTALSATAHQGARRATATSNPGHHSQ
jgi:hypothetical protein